jgi:membrane protein implicated in regulation of membrane protease activity
LNKFIPNIRSALILTPATFLLIFWILALSSGELLASIGLSYMLFFALMLSFGMAYSIALFVAEVAKQRTSHSI